MKMILAVLPRYRLGKVTRKLTHIEGFPGMTVLEGKGFGHEKMVRAHSAREELIDFTPNVRIEVVIPDRLVEPGVNAFLEASHTGERGDGKLFILPVEEAVRIKTKERGEDAV